MGFVITTFSILSGRFMGTDGFLTSELAKILFPTLIQVNATVIGFWGIIFVYYLKILFDYRNYFLKFNLRLAEKIDMLRLKMENSSDKNAKARTQQMITKWSNTGKRLLNLVDTVDITLREYSIIGISILGCFVVSIMLCVFSIGRITDIGIETVWITYSILPFLLGAVFSLLGILATSPTIPEEFEFPEKD